MVEAVGAGAEGKWFREEEEGEKERKRRARRKSLLMQAACFLRPREGDGRGRITANCSLPLLLVGQIGCLRRHEHLAQQKE